MSGDRWWWVGYTDDSRAAGQRARGCAIIRHPGPESAVAAELAGSGIAPAGARPLFGVIAAEWGDPPRGYELRLLNVEEAQALAMAWDTGHRGLADADDIKRAFLDDDAADGDPLFRKGGA